jgi:hypothetical protein
VTRRADEQKARGEQLQRVEEADHNHALIRPCCCSGYLFSPAFTRSTMPGCPFSLLCAGPAGSYCRLTSVTSVLRGAGLSTRLSPARKRRQQPGDFINTTLARTQPTTSVPTLRPASLPCARTGSHSSQSIHMPPAGSGGHSTRHIYQNYQIMHNYQSARMWQEAASGERALPSIQGCMAGGTAYPLPREKCQGAWAIAYGCTGVPPSLPIPLPVS